MMRFILMLIATAVVWPLSAMAVPPVQDAGGLLRDIEKGRAAALPDKGEALQIPLPPEMKSLGGTQVTVKTFRFAGNHLFGDETLASVVKPWLKTMPVDRQITPILTDQHPRKTPKVPPVDHRSVHSVKNHPDFFQVEVFHFSRGSKRINSASRPILDRAVTTLQNHPRVHLWVTAYSDGRGHVRANLKITQQRAQVVSDDLVAHGISPSRFTVRGLGVNHPVTDNDNAATRIGNRRVELYFLPDGENGFQNTIYFPPNATHLDDAIRQRLHHIAQRLTSHPELRLLLAGHTARIGNPNSNLQLSLHRAQLIAHYLTTLGADPSRITSKGFHADYPVADNRTARGRSKNRRVEIYYTTDPRFQRQVDVVPSMQIPVMHPAPILHTTAPQQTTDEGVRGRQLSFGDLQNAARSVAKYYRDAGWVVRTYLPRQDISTGVVTIQVVEARFGGVRMEGTSLVARSHVDRIIRKAQPVGKRIRGSAIERGVLLTGDLPGMSAKYALIKGKRDRETDLAISSAAASRINGYIRGDNGGSRSTGAGRVIGGLGINSPSGAGDKIDLTLLGSRGLGYWKLQYERPVGADGWQVGISGSMLKYRLGEEFTALNLKGSADTLEIHTSYPILRTRTANLYIRADIQRKLFNNEAQGVTTSHFTVDVPELSLSGNYYDTLWGAASSNARLSVVYGRVKLDGSPNAAAVAATTRTDGNYSRTNIALSRQQSIGQSLAAYLAFSGQYASRNLDSSEFMTLGGSNGVRAYPVAEGAGGSGWLLNVELRQWLPYHFTLIPFYDRGFIQVNRDNSFPGANPLNRYTLQGAGIALHWDPKPAFGINTLIARRIGKNPARQANGLDQDGSFHRYRVWVDGSYRF